MSTHFPHPSHKLASIFANDDINPITEYGIACLGQISTQAPQPMQFLISSLAIIDDFVINTDRNVLGINLKEIDYINGIFRIKNKFNGVVLIDRIKTLCLRNL